MSVLYCFRVRTTLRSINDATLRPSPLPALELAPPPPPCKLKRARGQRWLQPSADVAAHGWDGGGGRDSGMMALVYSRAMDDRQRAVQHQPQNRPLQNAQTANCDRSTNREPQTTRLLLPLRRV